MSFSTFLFSLLFLTSGALRAQNCVTAVERVTMDGGSIGQYYRFSPDGRYGLVSSGNGARLIDLEGRTENGQKYSTSVSTPMRAEVYADANWDFISSPLHNDGMRYYKFQDILDSPYSPSENKEAKPVFVDREHNNWYQSTATLPGGDKNNKKIRTCLYTGGNCQDYNFHLNDSGKVESVTKGDKFFPCRAISDGSRTEAEQAALLKEYNELSQQLEAARNLLAAKRREILEPIEARYRQASSSSRRAIETEYYAALARIDEEFSRSSGPILSRLRSNPNYNGGDSSISNPVLSKDGQYLCGMHKGTLHIFKFSEDKKSCKIVADTKYRASKANFEFPVDGKIPRLVFTAEGGPSGSFERGAVIFDPNSNTSMMASVQGDSSVYYPGFTRDGRVIYRAGGSFVIIDPNQLPANQGRKCIAKSAGANSGAATGESQGTTK